jgi:hypothetical protein
MTKPTGSIKTRNFSTNPVASPSLVHRRAAGPMPLDTRRSSGRDVSATGSDRAAHGCMVTVVFPQKQQTIYDVALSRDVSRQAIAELIARQLSIDPVHSHYLEMASDNWFDSRRLAIRNGIAGLPPGLSRHYEGRVQWDRRAATRSGRPSRALSDGAGGTLRGPPG